MMKIGKYDVGLLYNANAYFELKERLGGEPFDQLFPPSEDNQMDIARFEYICIALSEMITQNELWRRTEGYDRQDIPSLSYIKSHLKFNQIAESLTELMNAMVDGLHQDNEPEEVDLGLVELQKKTAE